MGMLMRLFTCISLIFIATQTMTAATQSSHAQICKDEAQTALNAYSKWEKHNNSLSTETTKLAVDRIREAIKMDDPKRMELRLRELSMKLGARLERWGRAKEEDELLTETQLENFTNLHRAVAMQLIACQQSMNTTQTNKLH